jgi:hypothetical protein
MQKWVGTAEAAASIGVTQRRLQALCGQGRIGGAQRIGRTWVLPASFRIYAGKRGPKLRRNEQTGAKTVQDKTRTKLRTGSRL